MSILTDKPALLEKGITEQQFLARLHNKALELEQPTLVTPTLTMKFWRLYKKASGEYGLRETGELQILAPYRNARPSKLGRSKDWQREPKALLAELLTPGSDAYENMVDQDVWQLGLAYCREARGLSGDQCLTLSRALNVFCVNRAGGVLDPKDVP